MDFYELMSRFGVALGVGLLIGLERGWRLREEQAGTRTAGIRTFAISGLLGGIAGGLSLPLSSAGSAGGGLLLGLSFAAYAGAITVFCLEENRAEKNFSATTAIAAIVTFALGAYALIGDIGIAGALAVVTAAILALRERLHGFIENITWPELRSALVLLAMTFVALPLLPNEPVGPYGGVNLREVWLIAIMLAGVSFGGYAAVKYFGTARGMLLAGAAGGLASSTAVTVTNAQHAAAGEGAPRLLAAGVALASGVMFLRVIVIVIAINASLGMLVAPALAAATAAAVAFALLAVYWRKPDKGEQVEIKFSNPFKFWPVIGFAVFLGVIIVVGRGLGETFGASGVKLGAAIVGLVDVDAITVSISRLVPDTLTRQDGAIAVLTAVATNTLSKIAIGAGIGRGVFALEIAGMGFVCFIAGGLALWLTFLFAAA
jgi:uncharacterized membrane protein (DUF4010 family)